MENYFNLLKLQTQHQNLCVKTQSNIDSFQILKTMSGENNDSTANINYTP